MSVAFRRESDEEHLEPKFERPLPPGPNLVTERGLVIIRAKIAELDAALVSAEDVARDAIKRDLRSWRTRDSSATVAPAATGEIVAFGTQVIFKQDGAMRRIAIVGSDEADGSAEHVPFTAPLARAMMGLVPGDLADFNGKADAIEIVEITPLTD